MGICGIEYQKNLAGQSYDGAAVMRAAHAGAPVAKHGF